MNMLKLKIMYYPFKSFVIFITICLVPTFSYSQDITLVTKYINDLCSKEMRGRGYGFDGEKKAANYIANQFDSIGISTLNNTRFMPFGYPINTFTGNVEISYDGKKMTTGKDYIIHPASNGIIGEFKTLHIDSIQLKRITKLKKSKYKNRAIFISEDLFLKFKKSPFYKEMCSSSKVIVVYNKKKLTMSIAREVLPFTIVETVIGTIPKKIKINLEQAFIPNYQSQNVIGKVKGTEDTTKSIYLTAHYDHLGSLGDSIYFPGANDNASGISMLLSLAAYYQKKSRKNKYSICRFWRRRSRFNWF